MKKRTKYIGIYVMCINVLRRIWFLYNLYPRRTYILLQDKLFRQQHIIALLHRLHGQLTFYNCIIGISIVVYTNTHIGSVHRLIHFACVVSYAKSIKPQKNKTFKYNAYNIQIPLLHTLAVEAINLPFTQGDRFIPTSHHEL